MNAEDYKILINKVWFRGFWVPGIANQRSDKKWRPKVEFINNDVVLDIQKQKINNQHRHKLKQTLCLLFLCLFLFKEGEKLSKKK